MLKDVRNANHANNGCVAACRVKKIKRRSQLVRAAGVRTTRTTLTTAVKRISSVFNVFMCFSSRLCAHWIDCRHRTGVVGGGTDESCCVTHAKRCY